MREKSPLDIMCQRYMNSQKTNRKERQKTIYPKSHGHMCHYAQRYIITRLKNTLKHFICNCF